MKAELIINADPVRRKTFLIPPISALEHLVMSQVAEREKIKLAERLMRSFACAREGNIAIMTALTIMPLMAATGAAVDYSFAIKAQNKLEQAAQIASTSGATAMRRVVNSYTNDTSPANSDYDSAGAAEGRRVAVASFTAQAATLTNVSVTVDPTTGVGLERMGNTVTAKLKYAAQVQTLMMKFYGVSTISISGQGRAIVSLLDEPGVGATGTNVILNETWVSPSNSVITNNPLQPTINNWYNGAFLSSILDPRIAADRPEVKGSGLPGAIRLGHPQGDYYPVISKRVYLPAGGYELRYWYRSTVVYPQYEPIHICGTVETEMNWVTSGAYRDLLAAKGSATTADLIANAQTARAGVYLRPIASNPQSDAPIFPPSRSNFLSPPDLTDFNRSYDSNNRIDICAYSSRWIERKISLIVSNSNYYWLSFVAEAPDHAATNNGFYLGPVKLCTGKCNGASKDNYPWKANDVLFSDSFEGANKIDGDDFVLTSGTTPAAAGYEKPVNWTVLGLTDNKVWDDGVTQTRTSRFAYGAAGAGRVGPMDGKTYVKIAAANVGLTRRLLLLPGYYRVKVGAGSQPSADACDPDDKGAYALNFGRQDWVKTMSKPTLAPLGTTDVASGSAPTITGCGNMATAIVACYMVTGTQFYDLSLGGETLGDDYTDSNGVSLKKRQTFDAVSIEFLSSNLTGGFPNPSQNCSYTSTKGSILQSVKSTFTVAGGDVWPGQTQVQLTRVTVTAALP